MTNAISCKVNKMDVKIKLTDGVYKHRCPACNGMGTNRERNRWSDQLVEVVCYRCCGYGYIFEKNGTPFDAPKS